MEFSPFTAWLHGHSLLAQRRPRTSASGLTTTTTADLNGDGAIDRLGSGTILQNADGSTVETASETNAADQSLRSETVTTTSADRLTVTTTRDINGDGAIDQSQTIATASDGTVTNTIVTFNPDGSRTNRTQTQTSANGLLTVTSADLNGDLVTDVSTVTRKFLNADGSIVETVIETNQDGTQRDRTVTTTSADGRNIEVAVILDTSGLVKYLKKTTVQNDGSTITVISYPNIPGTPIFASETDTRITSADGLNSSIRIINSTNNYYDVATATVLNSDGSQTPSSLNANVFEYDGTETVSGNGLNKSVHWTGPAFYDIPELTLDGTDTTVFNADGSTTRTVLNAISKRRPTRMRSRTKPSSR